MLDAVFQSGLPQKKNRLILLKVSWCVVSPTLKPEHKIYERLHEAKVKNIPEVYHGTDIGKEDDLHTTQLKIG